ncbi:hypothetical protein JOC34_000483 [Virgibacillus halotolerans]|uniref:hypothetical protein n=1 Tax=Virgibacillus halotolerans TaxID=1071053 RepID=UPI001961638D|nr:hypothetical protein [Virgibacillus halotolerans]MBM7598126.1 hypothetical protein [Virgibacillus halotolerans]
MIKRFLIGLSLSVIMIAGIATDSTVRTSNISDTMKQLQSKSCSNYIVNNEQIKC